MTIFGWSCFLGEADGRLKLRYFLGVVGICVLGSDEIVEEEFVRLGTVGLLGDDLSTLVLGFTGDPLCVLVDLTFLVVDMITSLPLDLLVGVDWGRATSICSAPSFWVGSKSSSSSKLFRFFGEKAEGDGEALRLVPPVTV